MQSTTAATTHTAVLCLHVKVVLISASLQECISLVCTISILSGFHFFTPSLQMELLLFLGELIGKHKVCMQQDEEEGTESWLGGNLQNRRYYNHTILHILHVVLLCWVPSCFS